MESPAGDGPPGRPLPAAILTAELLSIGSELTTGETRDTNAGELARSLTEHGVRVQRLSALPDDLDAVRHAFAAALARTDLVVSTGGLGPTPDDLTREAIAGLLGETPTVDPDLERWLRELWARREMAFPELNLKQAWIIPSARPIPNPNGTAPGWWVDTGAGLIVALPGPPREMRAMWHEAVLPQLRSRGLGRPQVVRTYRLAGIGESQVADLLGQDLLRAANPVVATYARADAVDVRISAVDETPDGTSDGTRGRPATELAEEATRTVLDRLGAFVWAEGAESWPEAIGRRLEMLGWTAATCEIATGGALAGLLGDAPWLRFSEIVNGVDSDDRQTGEGLEARAAALRTRAGADVALAVRVKARGQDLAVEIAVVTPESSHHERRLAFLGGAQGRSRAALLAAAVLLARLRRLEPEG